MFPLRNEIMLVAFNIKTGQMESEPFVKKFVALSLLCKNWNQIHIMNSTRTDCCSSTKGQRETWMPKWFTQKFQAFYLTVAGHWLYHSSFRRKENRQTSFIYVIKMFSYSNWWTCRIWQCKLCPTSKSYIRQIPRKIHQSPK